MALSKSQTEAARLLFNNALTDKEIEASVRIDARTLRRWKQLPEFTVEIDGLQQ